MKYLTITPASATNLGLDSEVTSILSSFNE